MANFLKRFNEQVIGTDDSLADYTSRIDSKGDFGRITSFNVILSSWSNILITPRRTWTWDPQFGSDVYKYIFEPATPETQALIKDEIMDSLMTFDSRAEILDIKVIFLPNKKGFNVSVYAYLDDEYGELNTTIDESAYFDFLRSS